MTYTRQFRGAWTKAYAYMQLYLLEMLAAKPDPLVIHIRLAKSLVTPEEIKQDFPQLREVLILRLGSASLQTEAVDGVDSHEIQIDYAPAPITGLSRGTGK